MVKVADELNKLLDLKKKGVLTQQEFDHLKARLLDLKSTRDSRIGKNISVAKMKGTIEMFFRNRPRLHKELFGPVPTFRKNEIPLHIQNNLDKYSKHVKSSCPECGYVGKMGCQRRVMPWYASGVSCFIYCLFLFPLTANLFSNILVQANASSSLNSMENIFGVFVIAFGLPIFMVYLIYDFFRRELVKCPECEKSYFLPKTFFN